MNLYIIGHRCSGKTSIGRILALKTGFSFFDTDDKIILYYNMTINEIISEFGWEYFRDKEEKELLKLSLKKNQIVSTGGGVILNPDNISFMKQSGIIIWLDTSFKNIKTRRIKEYNKLKLHPSLTDMCFINDLIYNFNFRDNIYRLASDFDISTDFLSIKFVVEYILYSISENLKIF